MHHYGQKIIFEAMLMGKIVVIIGLIILAVILVNVWVWRSVACKVYLACRRRSLTPKLNLTPTVTP